MWIGSEINPLCASANESGPLVNKTPLTVSELAERYDAKVEEDGPLVRRSV